MYPLDLSMNLNIGFFVGAVCNKSVDVHESSNPLAEKSELIDAAMPNSDDSTGNPTEPEVQSSGKKFDQQSDTIVLKGTMQHNNDVTRGPLNADSGSKVKLVDLQNGNETAIEITDACYHQPQALNGASHDSVSSEVSIGTYFNSVVVPSDNVTDGIPVEPDLQFPENDSGSVDVYSMSMEKRNDVQDATDCNA